jgi:hypothetical protein
MTLIKPLKWWGYLDDQGIIHVKVYVHDKAIQNYEQLPMVRGIFDPFWAYTKQQAEYICYQKYKEIQYYEKKVN